MKAVFYRDPVKGLTGFQISGHAGYARYGSDIVCSAVSALSENTVNAIERFTSDQAELTVREKDGFMEYHLKTVSPESTLLMNALRLGLESIEESYGKYLEIKEEETGSCSR